MWRQRNKKEVKGSFAQCMFCIVCVHISVYTYINTCVHSYICMHLYIHLIIVAFCYLKGACKKDGERLFTRACRDRTRQNDFKLIESSFGLYIKEKFFPVRRLGHWKWLPRQPWLPHHWKY